MFRYVLVVENGGTGVGIVMEFLSLDARGGCVVPYS
jgi:hypothetical protein